MENENVEIFDDEEVITLYDENDKPVDFAEIACVEYEGKFYALLQPIDEVDDIEEDEVIICLLEPQDDETEIITPITDEDLCEKIFNEYLKAVANEECNCDCENCNECETCEDDCECKTCDERDTCDCETCEDNQDCDDPCKDDCECGCGCTEKKK